MSPEHHIEAPTAFVAPQELHISDVQESTEPNEQTLLGLDESINRGGVSLGPSEFAIPLPMDARVKDDYETTINNESKHIRKFMTEPESGERMEVDVSFDISPFETARVGKMIFSLRIRDTNFDIG